MSYGPRTRRAGLGTRKARGTERKAGRGGAGKKTTVGFFGRKKAGRAKLPEGTRGIRSRRPGGSEKRVAAGRASRGEGEGRACALARGGGNDRDQVTGRWDGVHPAPQKTGRGGRGRRPRSAGGHAGKRGGPAMEQKNIGSRFYQGIIRHASAPLLNSQRSGAEKAGVSAFGGQGTTSGGPPGRAEKKKIRGRDPGGGPGSVPEKSGASVERGGNANMARWSEPFLRPPRRAQIFHGTAFSTRFHRGSDRLAWPGGMPRVADTPAGFGKGWDSVFAEHLTARARSRGRGRLAKMSGRFTQGRGPSRGRGSVARRLWGDRWPRGGATWAGGAACGPVGRSTADFGGGQFPQLGRLLAGQSQPQTGLGPGTCS